MNATVLDTITNAFVGALQSGQGAMQQYALPLLAAFALIAFYTQIGPLVMSGASLGDALGSVLLTLIKVGVFYWIIVNFAPMAVAAFDTFVQWGLAPTGGQFAATGFRQPSRVLDLGFRAVLPIQTFVQAQTGWGSLLNLHTLLAYSVCFWIIILAFAFVALHLMVTIIEFHMAVLVATVLMPWGVLQPTAFFTEFAIGWVTGGLIRVLVTIAVVGTAIPLFELVQVATTAGGDPTFYSAFVMMITSGIFAILSWVVPGRAAAIVGRGAALGLHGGTIIGAAASGVRGTLLVTAAVRGVSQLVRGR